MRTLWRISLLLPTVLVRRMDHTPNCAPRACREMHSKGPHLRDETHLTK